LENGISREERRLEFERLQLAVEEIEKQLAEKKGAKQRIVNDSLETQRDMWELSSAAPKTLDEIVEFMSYINQMKIQKRGHEFSKKLVNKYERMKQSPYFGRIDFIEDGEDLEEKIYIGIGTLIDMNNDFLIYDWRAPISGMFYDYEVGRAHYKCPACIVKGNITLKRQYKIKERNIEYMFDSSLKIDDEILQEILSKSTDNKMKTIVTTIQREQNKIIREEKCKTLIVQGPAGSGKTSIALHRIAYLLYRFRDKITSDNILIFSPNDIFNDYISNVLPELGEENMHQTTFKDYAHRALNFALSKEEPWDQMEYILNNRKDNLYETRIGNIQYKSSAGFIKVLKGYVQFVDSKDDRFQDIKCGDKLIISKEELLQLFHKDYKGLPLKRRLKKIRDRINYLLEPFEKQRIHQTEKELWDTGEFFSKVEVTEKSIVAAREEFNSTRGLIDYMTEFDLVKLYRELFQNKELFYNLIEDKGVFNNLDNILRFTLENVNSGNLLYEDQPALLYLKGAFGDIPDTTSIKYIIIDEVQDYTPLQHEIFRQLFPSANITMLGDLMQSINPYMNIESYNRVIELYPEAQLVNLSKSYRSTAEIAAFTNALLSNVQQHQWIDRHGDKPKLIKYKNATEHTAMIKAEIERLKNKGLKSIAVITRNLNESISIYNKLKDDGDIRLIKKEDEEYVNGIVVIPSYLAKGLEFDAVLAYDAGQSSYNYDEERNLFYTVCTRAMHELCIYYSGEMNSFLNSVNKDLYEKI
jgi:DNA helicase II / ATP-dependent DNA helicase PcrA